MTNFNRPTPEDEAFNDIERQAKQRMAAVKETTKAWWPGSSLKKYTDALQELADRLKKESEA